MTVALWVSVTVALLSFSGMVLVMLGNGKVSLSRFNIQNATDIAKQYKELNEGLQKEIDKNELKDLAYDQKFIDMEQKIKDMEKAFKKRESFLESEIEIRDVRLVEKDIRIVELEGIVILKDKIIANLKGEI